MKIDAAYLAYPSGQQNPDCSGSLKFTDPDTYLKKNLKGIFNLELKDSTKELKSAKRMQSLL